MDTPKWVYSEQVKEHFMDPHNVLEGKPDDFDHDGKGIAGSMQCGDEMLFLIKVDKAQEIITDCRWKTFGCASAIASASKLSDMVKGMQLEEAYQINANDIIVELGGLPDKKVHCSVLGDKALRAAIKNYYQRIGEPEKIPEDYNRLICECKNVTEKDIEDVVLDNIRDFRKLQEETGLGTVCGQCIDEAKQIMQDYIGHYFESRKQKD
ncbi:MAG: iron-sulfur cluster assembly scaffold protein [Candidatus Marinimicrobia bacterium]|nr:iron-sulfur cluster assembly scaffold protein [Candidatus Neomarinimicrobiota bacterium]